MRKNRELIALVIAFTLGSFLLSFVSGVSFVTTSSYLAPAIFVLYLCKYLLSGGKILNNLILEFRSKELGYIFFGSVILKTFISYGLRDFLQTLLSIGLVEWTVVALEMLSLAALVILLARLVLKTIPR